MNGPCWVPRVVTRTHTRSPSAAMLSTTTPRSGGGLEQHHQQLPCPVQTSRVLVVDRVCSEVAGEVQLGLLHWPPAQTTLDLQPLTLGDLAIVLVAFWAIEAEKLVSRLRASRRIPPGGPSRAPETG